MGYRVESALWENVFAVPGALVDEHLKHCDGAALKVLLVVLRKNTHTAPESIADFLKIPASEVARALHYWVGVGVLAHKTETEPPYKAAVSLMPGRSPQREIKAPADRYVAPPVRKEEAPPTPAAHAQKPGSFRKKLTPRQINEMSRADNSIAFLLQESQMILGKPLTPVATDTLTALYSYYGMNPEVILMLLQYCAAQGKDNMRYVEKVAAAWLEAGIDTHEKAEQEIVKADSRAKLENIIRRLFGIHDRALISSERDYINAWKEQGVSVELIGLAYERTIEQKGKISFAYLNGILQNWRDKGITGTEQALKEMRSKGKSSSEHTPGEGAALDEMEQIYRYGDVL